MGRDAPTRWSALLHSPRMGSKKVGKLAIKALKTGRQPPVAVVVSRYNASITDRLLDGAMLEYAGRGGRDRDLLVVDAPGAYELPAIALALAERDGKSDKVAGVVALGCIIKGETIHDRVIADAIAQGLVGVTLKTGVPVALGVITAESAEQAAARAGGEKGNKGREAMAAVLDTIGVLAAMTGKPMALKSKSGPRRTGKAGKVLAVRGRPKPDKAAWGGKSAGTGSGGGGAA